MPNAYRTHFAKTGRILKSGKVRTRCGYAMPAAYIGEANCTNCIAYRASERRVVDEATLEAYRVHKRIYCRKWRKRDPEKSRASYKASYYKNRESILASRKITYRITKEQQLAYHRKWNAANRDKVAAYNLKYRDSRRQKRLEALRGA